MQRPRRLVERGPARKIRKAINQINNATRGTHMHHAPGVFVKTTAVGRTVQVRRQRRVEAKAGMRFRGEWDADTAYSKDDVVVVRGGANGGTYIAVASVPLGTTPQDPTPTPQEGVYWVALARDQAGGVW